MNPPIQVLAAMQHCTYKAWRLSHPQLPDHPLSVAEQPPIPAKLRTLAPQLLADTLAIMAKDQPPSFYKIPHCSECPFKNECRQKLIERDCISLLPAMSPKSMLKYHDKGITTITQLSYLFKPRRSRTQTPHAKSGYLYALKALAIREQKTFVIQNPVLNDSPVAIFLDFEGTPGEQHIYLLGGWIIADGQFKESFSFWSDHKEQEEANFKKLITLLKQYPGAAIYHFGNYETNALKQAARRWPGSLKHWPTVEKRMVNLLSYLRTHVYPPTYGNGLKELGAYLNFQWNDPAADGMLSMQWRKQWEETGLAHWKHQLIRYNLDDCQALYHVCQWLRQLANNGPEKVQQVLQMKKHTPYRLQENVDFSEDFQRINKAAYFDYQRSKIYWRDKGVPGLLASVKKQQLKTNTGRDITRWAAGKADEIVLAGPVRQCPSCGHRVLYRLKPKQYSAAFRQIDLKFTSTGIQQYVREYRAVKYSCANCGSRGYNQPMMKLQYGDNFFVYALNLYVNYHISHELIAKIFAEQFGIPVRLMYLIKDKHRWWQNNWKAEVDYIWRIIRNSPVIHIDETSVRLQKDKGYVWVFATAHTVYYHFTLRRECVFLQTWLKGYEGVIITDFYPAYETIPVKQQKCLVHLIRDLNDDLFKNQFDEEYKQLVVGFGILLRKIIETIDRFGLKNKHLHKHVKDTDRFFEDHVEQTYKSELAGKCAKRLKKSWLCLWVFLHHDGVPWNNNNAEVAIKAFAQHRRGVNGQVHEKGITNYVEMLTVAQTCRYRNISFLNFLRKKQGIWENIPPGALPGFLPFQQARLYVRRLGFERKKQWDEWKQAGKRPSFIPSNPDKTYKEDGWKNWHHWIGFTFLPFEKARTYMRRLHLKNRAVYIAWLASGKRPKFIPAVPEKEYQYTGWVSLQDYLGIS